jgi:uncharacterized protein YchJ
MRQGANRRFWYIGVAETGRVENVVCGKPQKFKKCWC